MTVRHNHTPTQAPNLEINEVADGLVVFDPIAQQVHYLNSTASVVFELCDGETPEDAMTGLAAAVVASDDWSSVLGDCLDDLRRRKLVH